MKHSVPAHPDAAALADLIGSRLCHDLISPLGAIGNGVELLGMMPDLPQLGDCPEMGLIRESVEAARARIRAFRMAFGVAGEMQRVAPAEISSLITDLTGNSRLRITAEIGQDQPRGEIKLLMLALMCLTSALPWGGAVRIAKEERFWTLRAEADRTRPEPALWSWLDADQSELPAAADVHFAIFGSTARQSGRRPAWAVSETEVTLRF
ncbi:MAG: histidine phosphotransferase family protein [Paracoccus sp. (in: a-proteobacteria)]|nr:histidine phosphotransferase family protein [Paracoccus sp. (in: a-proteobacteria)]